MRNLPRVGLRVERKRKHRPSWILPSVVSVMLGASLLSADSFVVTSTSDAGPGSLRQALMDANANLELDDIDFAVSGVIQLLGVLPQIVEDVNINGPGADLLTIRRDDAAANGFRIFEVLEALTTRISGLRIENGSVSEGGGIRNEGKLTVEHCIITGNSANFRGGGIFNEGILTLLMTTVSGNSADKGGGISNSAGTLRVEDCVVTGNTATSFGGGIGHSGGLLTILRTTISGNVTVEFPGPGGGLFLAGLTTIDECLIEGNTAAHQAGAFYTSVHQTTIVRNSTISGNMSPGIPGNPGVGGIISYHGHVELHNCTITGNDGGLVTGRVVSNDFHQTHISNTIIAGNEGYDFVWDPSGEFNDLGHNLIGNNDGIESIFPAGQPNRFGDFVGTPTSPLDPGLLPLGDSGGPTMTHAPSIGSVAIDNGRNTSAPGPIDQRGEPRIVDGDCNGRARIDIGAVEAFLLADPAAGTVNLGADAVTNVLLVNGQAGGSERTVTLSFGDPLCVELLAPPAGAASGRYFMMAWREAPSGCWDLSRDGESVGALVNPIPLHEGGVPQPFRCLRGAGIPDAVCGGLLERRAPAAVPWKLTRPGGVRAPHVFVLQAVLRDVGSAHPSGFSVSNAVTVRVE